MRLQYRYHVEDQFVNRPYSFRSSRDVWYALLPVHISIALGNILIIKSVTQQNIDL